MVVMDTMNNLRKKKNKKYIFPYLKQQKHKNACKHCKKENK